MADSLFVPGVKVAIIRGGWSPSYEEAVVDKVYKTGNFTLKGDRQQYRPHFFGARCARGTGNHYPRWTVEILDDVLEAQIAENRQYEAKYRARRRLFEGVKQLKAEADCDLISRLLALIDAAKPEEPSNG